MSQHPRVAELTRILDLRPHPEGGCFREIYRSPDLVVRAGAPLGRNASRAPLGRNASRAPLGRNASGAPLGRNASGAPLGRNASREPRGALTSIFFVLAAGECSRWHVVELDEVWVFHEGAPLELVLYDPAMAEVRSLVLGPASTDGARPQHVVPRGVWQAARTLGDYSLTGAVVAPAFDFADFRFCSDVAGHEAVFAGPLAPWRALL